jgi:hypothetical protein
VTGRAPNDGSDAEHDSSHPGFRTVADKLMGRDPADRDPADRDSVDRDQVDRDQVDRG